jgi:ABC-2 type transport system ATP-binding protein
VLEAVGLTDATNKRVGTYSLGMGQRLGIATALLGEPEVLVLDEPVNGLDPEGIRWIRRFLKSYAADGRTVLLSSHLMSEMANTADDLVVISNGRVVTQGTLDEITVGHASLEDAFFALTATQLASSAETGE